MALEEREMKVWLGLEQPELTHTSATGVINLLQQHVGEFDTYQSGISGLTSHSEHESYLTGEGFSSDDASSFTDQIKQAFTDDDSSGSEWDEYNDFVQNEASTYIDLETRFANTATWGSMLLDADGTAAAGIRVFESDGLTKDGVAAPAGTVEVFGVEVHFSQSGSAASGSTDASWSNLRSDATNDVAKTGETVAIKADVKNQSASEVTTVTAQLTEDGVSIDSQTAHLRPDETRTISFDVRKDEITCHDYGIGGLGPLGVCWQPGGL